jgi:hypothetical protein
MMSKRSINTYENQIRSKEQMIKAKREQSQGAHEATTLEEEA